MSNVCQEEVNKFSNLSYAWWDLNGPFKTLHHINPVRLAFTKSAASLNGVRVLDVGCGGGIFSEALAKEGAAVTAIDLSPDAILAAQAHAETSKLDINYRHLALEQLNDGLFDIITCYELLEHVPSPENLIRELSARLKNGGKLFLSTINRTPKAYLQAIIGAEYILGLLPRQTHDYKKFIKPSELAAFSRGCKLNVVNIKGMHYQPITAKASLTEDVSVNYLMVCEKELSDGNIRQH